MLLCALRIQNIRVKHCQTNAIPVGDLPVSSSHTVKSIEYPNGRMKRLDAHMRKLEVANHEKSRGQHRSTTIDLTNRTILQQPWHSWHQAHLHPNHRDSTESWIAIDTGHLHSRLTSTRHLWHHTLTKGGCWKWGVSHGTKTRIS